LASLHGKNDLNQDETLPHIKPFNSKTNILVFIINWINNSGKNKLQAKLFSLNFLNIAYNFADLVLMVKKVIQCLA